MDGKPNTRILFVQYQGPGGRARSPPSGSGQISQQKHAAREYHRKAKEKAPVSASPGSVHQVMLLPSSPASGLGAGRRDPFDSYAVKNLSPHAHRMLDYSLTYQWPLFSFANPGATVDDMKRHMMGRIMFSATSLYGVVFVGATHWALCQYGQPVPAENAMMRLDYKHSALKHLVAEVQKIGPDLPNETLYVMMAMAAYGQSREKPTPTPYRPAQSVLATAHELQFHSRLPVEWAHLRALFRIVQDRGGLRSFTRPGFALITSFYDIMLSCQRLAVPAFPLLEPTESLLRSWPPAAHGRSVLSVAFSGRWLRPSV